MQHIPYKGDAQALNDLIAGQVDLMFCAASSAMPQIQAGRPAPSPGPGPSLSTRRPSSRPSRRAGAPGHSAVSWMGLFAPAGLPPRLTEQIGRDAARVLDDPGLRRRQAAVGAADNEQPARRVQALCRLEPPKWSGPGRSTWTAGPTSASRSVRRARSATG